MTMIDVSHVCKDNGHNFVVMPTLMGQNIPIPDGQDSKAIAFATFCTKCGETRKVIFN